MRRERPISAVPGYVLICLPLALILQVVFYYTQGGSRAKIEDLTAPPSLHTFRLMSFGEPIVAAKLTMLGLQSRDSVGGQQQSLQQLNYAHLNAWLTRIVELDPQAQYPFFVASQFYAVVENEAKQRLILDWIYRSFLQDPDRRWKALAHAAILARHGLKDMSLAQTYARAIRLHATGSGVPPWAKQMEIFLLEDMNELEHAKILLGGLMQSGQITDIYEMKFLEQRLIALENKIAQRK
ncbi:MAG: hypothetical protein HY253_05215 [Burkholderiales bacterium]|nr:hypothetical protein [Burkholderiales bacterium]